MERQDFQAAVQPFFQKVRAYDRTMHGKLSDYLVEAFMNCLALKSERCDYSFIPRGINPAKIKEKEELLIASHAFKIAISELPGCQESDMVDIYDGFREIGRRRGWSGLDFDKNCLSLMGVELKKVGPPIHVPQVQSGKDYN